MTHATSKYVSSGYLQQHVLYNLGLVCQQWVDGMIMDSQGFHTRGPPNDIFSQSLK